MGTKSDTKKVYFAMGSLNSTYPCFPRMYLMHIVTLQVSCGSAICSIVMYMSTKLKQQQCSNS